LRPVSRAVRVGEQSAQVWKVLYFKPLVARRSRVGMLQGPPNAPECPKPISSSKTITMLGEPGGALISKRGGALASRASNTVLVGYCGSRIGRAVRSSSSVD